jgi:phage-related tail fiber protein
MIFSTIHTTIGLQRIAQAEATGTPINLVEMAVGDGNGNTFTTSEGMTGLVRECYRAAVNRVFQDPDNPQKFTAELIVPASVGGFTIREIGIFDSDGSLFAVANTPDAYKPTSSEGAYSDGAYRMEFMAANASVITLQIDPNVAVATQTWIQNNVTTCTLLPGGTTGQVLRKASNGCGDTEWGNPADVNVVVSTIEETQTLATSQTVVILSTVTTNGLAVYVEGERLDRAAGAFGWQPDALDPDTTIVLGASYTAGSRITLVQNEPLGDVQFPLARDQNLADLPNKATSRANLDVYSKAETDQRAPAGAVVHFARSTAPTGWLKANGAAVSRTAYDALFAVIGTNFGAGDGFNTFNLPDLRGEFLRGLDDGRGLDSGRGLGTVQASQNLAHAHGGSTTPSGEHNHALNTNGVGAGRVGVNEGALHSGSGKISSSTTTAANHQHGIASDGGSEARPRNVALLACIKF